MRENREGCLKRVKQYLLSLPIIVAVLRLRDKISAQLLKIILGFFSCVAPVWNFLFLKTEKPENGSDEATENGPTGSYGSEVHYHEF